MLEQTPGFVPHDLKKKKRPIACLCLILLLSGFDLLVELNQSSVQVKTTDHWLLLDEMVVGLKKEKKVL